MDDVLKKLRNLNGSILGIEEFLIYLSNYIVSNSQNVNHKDIFKHIADDFFNNATVNKNDYERLKIIQFLITQGFFYLPENNIASPFLNLLLNDERFEQRKSITPSTQNKSNKFLEKIKPIIDTWKAFRIQKETIEEQRNDKEANQTCVDAADGLFRALVTETISIARQDNTSNLNIEKIKHAGAHAHETSQILPDMVSGQVKADDIEQYLEKTKPLSFSDKIWIHTVTFATTVTWTFGLGLLGSAIPGVGTLAGLVTGIASSFFIGGISYKEIKNRLSKHSDLVSEKQKNLVAAAKSVQKNGKSEIEEPITSVAPKTEEMSNFTDFTFDQLIPWAKMNLFAARELLENRGSELYTRLSTPPAANQNLRLDVGEIFNRHWKGLKEANVAPPNWPKLCVLFTQFREIAVNVPISDRILYLIQKREEIPKPAQKRDIEIFSTEIKRILPMIIAGCKETKKEEFKKLNKQIEKIKLILETDNIFETVDLLNSNVPLDNGLISKYLNDVKDYIEKTEMKFEIFCQENKEYTDFYNKYYSPTLSFSP